MSFTSMISRIESTHRIRILNPHIEFSYRVLICRFRGSQCGLIWARGVSGGWGRVRCVGGAVACSGGVRAAAHGGGGDGVGGGGDGVGDGGGSICGGGGGGGSGGFGVGGGGSGGFGVDSAASASAASASAASAARARRRCSACGRGCVGSALSSTVRGCDQAFVIRACKQAAWLQVCKQHWQWQDQAVDSRKQAMGSAIGLGKKCGRVVKIFGNGALRKCRVATHPLVEKMLTTMEHCHFAKMYLLHAVMDEHLRAVALARTRGSGTPPAVRRRCALESMVVGAQTSRSATLSAAGLT